jgi:hypothetical protein
MSLAAPPRHSLHHCEILHMLYNAANEPDILKESEKRQNCILDADYREVEVVPFVQELEHLTKDEKETWGKTLKNFPNMVCRWTRIAKK